MSGFLDCLKDGLQSCAVEGGSVLLAVSGGADSVALMRGTLQLQQEMKLRLIACHLNHNLRGEESRQDAEWVMALCEKLGVPIVMGSENVAVIAQSRKQGVEETARQVRYAFFEDTARKEGCTHIAVAHTADDQVETILHHIIRGTGLNGLQGMRPVRPLPCKAATSGRAPAVVVVRPMLEITRQQVAAYLAELGQDFRTDLTNVDRRFTRSRIRRTLLPLLERDFNPQVGEALLRLGRQARDVQQAMEELAGELMSRAVEDRTEHVCRLNCEVLSEKPRHLVRECLTAVWKAQGWPLQSMGFAEWDRLADLVTAARRPGGHRPDRSPGGPKRPGRSGAAALTLPGDIEARRRGNLLVLCQRR